MRLSLEEQETIITFDEKYQVAEIYTCNGKLKRRLAELLERRPNDVAFKYSDEYAVAYTIPKTWVRINPPKAVAPLSEEEKAIRSERMKNIRAKQLGRL